VIPSLARASCSGWGGGFYGNPEGYIASRGPLEKRDALEMMKDIKGHKILVAVRGMEAADLYMLSDILIKMGQIGLENESVKEIDINPVIIFGNNPVAVDALFV
jgi:acetyl-CoA synthetase (ADP-forming)